MSEARRSRFEALYRQQHATVLGYVLRRTGNPDDAADVIAETFVVAWRRLESVPAGDEARLWLYGVARRVLANHRRGERRRFSLADRLRAELAVAPVVSASFSASASASAELGELAAAFRQLPDGDREVLALEGWEGLDVAQIAAVLGCSRNAVRIRLHRARRRLGQRLAGHSPAVPTAGTKVAHGENA